ncbi:MAG: hypothetical protein GOU98_03590 [Candidatus Altiarchaeota archaeon]|nr:hypothetical protein [Candidatus Altiarchaeota archaeon]
MRIHLVLAAMVFLAGCVGGGNGTTTDNKETTTGTETKKVYGEELHISIDGLPTEMSGVETEYFKLITEAEESVENVRVLVYNLGSYLDSSCAGSNSLRDVTGGEVKEVSCTLNMIEEPLEEIEQEIFYEATYKVKEYAGQVSLKVYDSDEFERINPTSERDSVDLGVGILSIEENNVEEGSSVDINIELDGDLSTGDCGCNIEKAIVKIPKGFSVSGFTGWTRYSCGTFNCYQRQNIDTPLISKATISISGVVKTDTFYIGAEISGAWKVSRGSDTVILLD